MNKEKPFDSSKKGIVEKAQEANPKARVKNEKAIRKKVRNIERAIK